MTIPTFVPPMTPTAGSSDEPEIKVLKAEFGDGYTQAARDGTNSIRRVVTLKWQYLPQAKAQAILDFFIGLGGCNPFTYRIPGEASAIQWTCEKWGQEMPGNNFRHVSATLRQNFNLV